MKMYVIIHQQGTCLLHWWIDDVRLRHGPHGQANCVAMAEGQACEHERFRHALHQHALVSGVRRTILQQDSAELRPAVRHLCSFTCFGFAIPWGAVRGVARTCVPGDLHCEDMKGKYQILHCGNQSKTRVKSMEDHLEHHKDAYNHV